MDGLIMRTQYLLIMLTTAALVSCQKENAGGGGDAGDAVISCIVNMDGDGFTKGWVINGTAVKDSGINVNGNKFVLDAWLEAENRAGSEKGVTDDTNPHYLNNKVFTNDGTQWACAEATWRNEVFTNFWAVFPNMSTGLELNISTDVPSDAEQKKPKLTYDMSSLSVAHSVTNAAEQSKDVLVAYARQKYKHGDSDSKSNLTLQFSHATSAIKFKKGTTFTSGCDITYISISGIHLKGECVCTGDPNTKPQSTTFAWTTTDTPAATDAFTLKQETDLAGLTAMEKGGKVLFVIPQELPKVATLSANITGGKNPGVKTVNITGYSWKVGKQYTYTLSYDEDADKLDVSVAENYSNSDGTWTD